LQTTSPNRNSRLRFEQFQQNQWPSWL
jgi:hypothetical protein